MSSVDEARLAVAAIMGEGIYGGKRWTEAVTMLVVPACMKSFLADILPEPITGIVGAMKVHDNYTKTLPPFLYQPASLAYISRRLSASVPDESRA